MARFFKYLGYLLFLPIWWAQRLIPRKADLWVFGAWNGNRFSDNSKYLYLYVKQNHPEITCVWLTRNPEIRDSIRDMEGDAFLINSLNGFFYSLRAKNYVVSSGRYDVNFLCSNGARWIQLWHGNPMKKIGLDDKFSSVHRFFSKKMVPILFPFVRLFDYDYVVSNAPVFTDKMASAFGIPTERVLETGCPRNDAFFQTGTHGFNKVLREKFKDSKLVYYLPTFRDHVSSRSLFSLGDYDEAETEAFLTEENLVLVSKGHYVDTVLSTAVEKKDSRIIHLSDEKVDDINLMLKDADLLITDYSGAYFDFLLLERPIIFAAFDLRQYLASSRELYFDYEDVVAGPIVTDWMALRNGLKTIWNDEKFARLVEIKNKEFNKYHDANNSQRVFKAILNLSEVINP